MTEAERRTAAHGRRRCATRRALQHHVRDRAAVPERRHAAHQPARLTTPQRRQASRQRTRRAAVQRLAHPQ
eukprot:scaffold12104_cov73-Phaeocystis_antarctica.AAC.1